MTTIPESIAALWKLDEDAYDAVRSALVASWEAGGNKLGAIEGYEFRGSDDDAARFWERYPALVAEYSRTHPMPGYHETDTKRQPAGPSSICYRCGGPCADGSGDCGECR